MKVTWELKSFGQLGNLELYEMLALRERVFIVEQKCPYPDCDGKDLDALHLLGRLADPGSSKIVAYLRILKPGVRYAEASIGRVVVAPEFRRMNLGRALTTQGLGAIRNHLGPIAVRISAQAYLEKFYSEFGFVRVGGQYMEDWIPHVEMLRPSDNR
jgi:ElaA protein